MAHSNRRTRPGTRVEMKPRVQHLDLCTTEALSANTNGSSNLPRKALVRSLQRPTPQMAASKPFVSCALSATSSTSVSSNSALGATKNEGAFLESCFSRVASFPVTLVVLGRAPVHALPGAESLRLEQRRGFLYRLLKEEIRNTVVFFNSLRCSLRMQLKWRT